METTESHLRRIKELEARVDLLERKFEQGIAHPHNVYEPIKTALAERKAAAEWEAWYIRGPGE